MASPLARHFLLDPRVTFLNHGSYGACPRPVFATYRRWQRRLEAQPVAFMDPHHLAARFADVRRSLASEVGADPDDLVWVTNATAGLNAVARSLDLKPGDEVLTTDHEYAALEKTWAFVAARTGAIVRRVEVPLPLVSEEAFTDAVLAGVTARTRVLFLSHVTSPTALVFPLAKVIAAARERGVLTVIDGAHGPGLVPLDLDALGADFYVGNCHKWLMAPKGAGFLHARRDRQFLLAPAVISHGWTEAGGSPGPFGQSAFLDAFGFQGTRDPAAWLAVPAALRFRDDHDWASVAKQCRNLASETARVIQGITGIPPLAASDFCAPQMMAIPIPERDPVALHDWLLRVHGIEVPVIRWRGRTIVRLSVQGYNDAGDTGRLVAALREELGR